MLPNPFNTIIPVLDGTFRLAIKIWLNNSGEFKKNNRVAIAWPGWLDNAGSFDTLAPILAKKLDMDIVVVDPPGNGWSEHKPPSVIYAETDEYVLIGHVADSLGIDTFMLIGHSRGGAICAMAASIFASRVRAMVIFESGMGVFRDAEPETLPKLPERVLIADEMFMKNRLRPLRVFNTIEEAIEFNATNDVFPKNKITARNIVMRQLRPCKGGFTFIHDVRTYGQKHYVTLTEEQVKAFIQEITCPVLRIMRESSQFFPKPGQKELTRIQQQYRDRVSSFKDGLLTEVKFPGDHHLHSDYANEVAEIVISFLTPLVDRKPSSRGAGNKLNNNINKQQQSLQPPPQQNNSKL
jgi:pimeloyl-ACP methyl ester carboxylesterase